MNKKKKLSLLLLILLLLGLLTAAVLASRLGNLNKKKDDSDATIAIGDDAERVNTEDSSDGDVPLEARLVVRKDAKIFCTSYEDGHVTVRSANGNKVIAPGTKWDYKFTLKNEKNASLDYKLYFSAEVEGLEKTGKFPVQARLKGPEKWAVGSSTKYVPVLKIDELVDEGVLAGGNTASYTFGWKWPFNGDNEFDTMLGNLAIDHPIILKIHIWVYAWNDEIPDKPGGDPPAPPTGDNFNIGLWMSLMIISLLVFVAVLARDRKERSAVQAFLAQTADETEEKRE